MSYPNAICPCHSCEVIVTDRQNFHRPLRRYEIAVVVVALVPVVLHHAVHWVAGLSVVVVAVVVVVVVVVVVAAAIVSVQGFLVLVFSTQPANGH